MNSWSKTINRQHACIFLTSAVVSRWIMTVWVAKAELLLCRCATVNMEHSPSLNRVHNLPPTSPGSFISLNLSESLLSLHRIWLYRILEEVSEVHQPALQQLRSWHSCLADNFDQHNYTLAAHLLLQMLYGCTWIWKCFVAPNLPAFSHFKCQCGHSHSMAVIIAVDFCLYYLMMSWYTLMYLAEKWHSRILWLPVIVQFI